MNNKVFSLVDFIIDNKKLTFSINELESTKYLIEYDILKVNNNTVSVSNFNIIASYFVNKYKKKLNFKTSNKFNKNVIFLKGIKEDFCKKRHIPSFYKLEKELWRIILLESNLKFQCSFTNYIKSIDKNNNSQELSSFIDVYSDELINLELTETTIYDNSILLLDLSKTDAHYSVPISNILNSIKEKCEHNYNLGLKLLAKAFFIDEDKESLLSSIISGLYSKNKISFYSTVLEHKIDKNIKLNAIFFGLSNVSKIENTECKLFLRIFERYKLNNSLTISLLSLLISIVKSKNTEYHNISFEKIKLTIKNEDVAYFILNNISSIKNHNENKTDIVIELISQEYFSMNKYINAISHFFWRAKDIKPFKKIILALIEKEPFTTLAKQLESNLESLDKNELDLFIIELLTDDLACKRFIGLDLFDEVPIQTPYVFSIDILTLPPIIQYKLWVSLTQDFNQPEKRITTLLPLTESSSEYIKESFLCKLEELSEDYAGHITKILEENLDKKKLAHTKAIERIKIYIENFFKKYADVKTDIKELNPYQTHYKHIKEFNKLFYKKINTSVKEGAVKNSLLSVFGANTVKLAKGGGWRIRSDEKVSSLGKFGSSFTMPRNYFINPNKYEIEKGFHIRQNWTVEEFKETKTFIDNE